MPIDFRDAEELAERGYAAVLRVLRRHSEQPPSFAGALLLVNACGEPVEFVHNCIGLPATSLCAPDRLPAFAAKSLVTTLFGACVYAPLFVGYAQDEIDEELFVHRLVVRVPVAAITGLDTRAGGADPAPVRWLVAPPAPGSRAAVLFDTLSSGGLLMDALARAGDALRLMRRCESDDVVG